MPHTSGSSITVRASRGHLAVLALVSAIAWGAALVLLVTDQQGAWLLAFLPSLFWCALLVLPALSSGPPAVVDAGGVTAGRGRTRVPWSEAGPVSLAVAPGGAGYLMLLARPSGRPLVLASPVAGPWASRRTLLARLEPVYAAAGEHRARISVRPFRRGARFLAVLLACLQLLVLVVAPAVLAALSAPWTRPWWPGRDEAARLPSACAAGTASAARLVPGAAPESGSSASPDDRSCAWGAQHPPPEMSIRLEREERRVGPGGGASERTRTFYRDRAAENCPVRVPGLGDEACSGTEREADRTVRAVVVARRGNVLVTVLYRAAAPEGQVAADAVQAARSALASVAFA
ncbi:hypothetical protein [Actinomadura parmotrematis]|uniref:Uncharacterized protein n=1 Tax=Actinomadura parmotrematis TaxID=2864039 RepID=A0ABS7FLQ6_9ACTN|nr:hypothetical protein [Actinomadura parmotrematis]MBW8481312.1 hypothetical protein [Actinomadura parmotrematis]